MGTELALRSTGWVSEKVVTMPEQMRRVDDCVRATQHALMECARSKEIDPEEEDVSDPAWCLAAEATCLLREVRALLGKRPLREYYA